MNTIKWNFDDESHDQPDTAPDSSPQTQKFEGPVANDAQNIDSPEPIVKNLATALKTKMNKRVIDTGVLLQKPQQDEIISMKTSAKHNSIKVDKQNFQKNIQMIQRIEQTNAQKRIMISPISSLEQSSSNYEKAKFLQPTSSVLIDDLKSVDYNRNQKLILPKEDNQFQPNRDIVDMNQTIYSYRNNGNNASIQSKHSFKNGLAAYTKSKPLNFQINQNQSTKNSNPTLKSNKLQLPNKTDLQGNVNLKQTQKGVPSFQKKDDLYQLTDPQGQLAKSNHLDYFNQMQQLGDVMSKKGEDHEDPDFDQMEVVHEKLLSNNNTASNSKIAQSNKQRGLAFDFDDDFSLKNGDNLNPNMLDEIDHGSSIRNIRDHRAELISRGNASRSESHKIGGGKSQVSSSNQHVLSMQSMQLKEHFERIQKAQKMKTDGQAAGSGNMIGRASQPQLQRRANLNTATFDQRNEDQFDGGDDYENVHFQAISNNQYKPQK